MYQDKDGTQRKGLPPSWKAMRVMKLLAGGKRQQAIGTLARAKNMDEVVEALPSEHAKEMKDAALLYRTDLEAKERKKRENRRANREEKVSAAVRQFETGKRDDAIRRMAGLPDEDLEVVLSRVPEDLRSEVADKKIDIAENRQSKGRGGLRRRNGERLRVTATVQRFGLKRGFNGPEPTVLLKNVRDSQGNRLADHLWMAKGKTWDSVREGNRVAFDGRVDTYQKGYFGRRECILKEPSVGFKLTRPTKLEVLC